MAFNSLTGCRLLIVEDEYYLADEARAVLSDVGAEVLGPVATVDQAISLIESNPAIDCVLLDVKLRGEMAFAFAETLQTRAIPFAFVTGYDKGTLPDRFGDAPVLQKPVHARDLIRVFEVLAGRSSVDP